MKILHFFMCDVSRDDAFAEMGLYMSSLIVVSTNLALAPTLHSIISVITLLILKSSLTLTGDVTQIHVDPSQDI